MRGVLIRFLPEHLRPPKMQYMTGVLVLCILATLSGALASPLLAVRIQCWIMTLVLMLFLVLFVRGLSLQKTIDRGSVLAIVHVTLVAFLSQTIYTSAQAWLLLLSVTLFYVSGRKAGIRWTGIVMLALIGTALYRLLEPEAGRHGFGIAKAWTSLSDYLLITLIITVVPWIYKNRVDEALAESQQRQRDLQAKQVELEHAQQMQEHFIASVSHELRTPMNAILGLHNLLLERVKDKPQAS